VNPPRVDRIQVLLSLQRALWGEVFPALRAVTVEYSEASVKFVAYVDGPLEDTDADSLSAISAEVSADFLPGVDIDYEVVRRDSPMRIDDGRLLVYRRREVSGGGC